MSMQNTVRSLLLPVAPRKEDITEAKYNVDNHNTHRKQFFISHLSHN